MSLFTVKMPEIIAGLTGLTSRQHVIDMNRPLLVKALGIALMNPNQSQALDGHLASSAKDLPQFSLLDNLAGFIMYFAEF